MRVVQTLSGSLSHSTMSLAFAMVKTIIILVRLAENLVTVYYGFDLASTPLITVRVKMTDLLVCTYND